MPPLFVSRRTLRHRKGPMAINTDWALDSGGFSELSMYGKWETGPDEYIEEVRKWHGWGRMAWAAAQDWMCEPVILQKTGKSVKDHQILTIDNYLYLKGNAPEIPWTPVIQGWEPSQYEEHVKMYSSVGVDLTKNKLVGIGSVCRRQHTFEIECLIKKLHSQGLKLHGFGFKLLGLKKVADYLESADSLAWSFAGRRSPPLEGHKHKNCANCKDFALLWRNKLMQTLSEEQQKFNEYY